VKRKILVTSALPYANGRIHAGHIAGAYLPADIYTRYQKLAGNDVIYICGSDENGVPITIVADKEGTTPQEVVDKFHFSNKKSFERLGIDFDIYSRTSDSRHAEISQKFFLKIFEKGYIEKRTTKQLFCESCSKFLPDRYVNGTCHYCGYDKAKGDQCESCGKLIDATLLKDPTCAICGATPVVKETDHWFFLLDKLQDRLAAWLGEHPDWRDNVSRFTRGWLERGLEPRSITRDIFWGIPVPLDDAAGKVLYVWFDAPIGYFSFTQEWAEGAGAATRWKDFWLDKGTEIIHFIGKDNIVFHAIVWPAMLMAHGDINLPHNIVANEFLNLKGRKSSKSQNWAIWVEDALDQFAPDQIRYYLAAVAPEGRDTDFWWDDFQTKNNTELADILGNFIHRTLTFLAKYFDGKIPAAGNLASSDETMRAEITTASSDIASLMESFRFKAALQRLMKCAKAGNVYFDEKAPWASRKNDADDCAVTMNVCANTVGALSIVMQPFMPFAAGKLRATLKLNATPRWEEITPDMLAAGHQIQKPEVLFQKIETDTLEKAVKRMGS